MRMYPAVSIITLGVADVARASRFYQSLGWRLSSGASTANISFFSLNNIVLALFNEDSLAADSGFGSAMVGSAVVRNPTADTVRRPAGDIPGQAIRQEASPASDIVPPRIVLAQNYPSESAVRQAMDEAVTAGGRMLVAPEKTFWGGYHGIYADPDGHVWELAHNPFVSLAPDGSVALPD